MKPISKEKMESLCTGKEDEDDSVNDDLESIFHDIRLGVHVHLDEISYTYHLPKLTKYEMKLLEIEDFSYLFTFNYYHEMDEMAMRMSESKSKYVEGVCYRRTLQVENSSIDRILRLYLESMTIQKALLARRIK